MAISAAMVKELRERTGAGMMECKKALTETDGDLESAIELLRKKGAASADKKAGRIAAEGVIAAHVDDGRGVLIEINSETDFVAKEPSFVDFTRTLAALVAQQAPSDLASLLSTAMDGKSVDEARLELVAKIGEKIDVRRFESFDTTDGSQLFSYLHGHRIGVMVELIGGDEELGKDLAMHIAASNPLCATEDDMDPAMVQREREIFLAQATESGKPPEIAEKMVTGRIKKFLKQNTLVGQDFVKDPDTSVGDLLEKHGAKLKRYVRYEVGEGIEKKEDDFVAEVMAQAKAD